MADDERPPRAKPYAGWSSLGFGLVTLAGIVALARREPLRLAILGLVVSVVAVLAKFLLVALVVAVVMGLLGGIG